MLKLVRNLLTGLLILVSIGSFAQLGGSAVFPSLNIGGSARIAALGGNQIAVKDGDLHLGMYNPALLDSTSHKQLALSYVNYFSDVNFGFASYAHHIDSSKVTLAGTMQYMSYGKFSERDVTGEKIGEFSAGDYITNVGAGYELDTNFSIGANLKFIYSNLENYYSTGLATDLAGTYQNKQRKIVVSAMIRNLGFQMTSYGREDRESLPLDIQLGFSKQLKHAPFRFSVIADNLQQWDLTYPASPDNIQIDPISGEPIEENNFEFGDKLMRHIILGVEVLITDNLHFRAGYNYRKRQELKVASKAGTVGISWGLGFRVSKFHFSYGRFAYHLAGPSNHFSITTTLSDW